MKKSNYLIFALFSLLILYSLINLKETNANAITVLSTFSTKILPALLPFLIMNQLLIRLGIIDILAYFFQYISYPIFKISGKGASVTLIGILCGFPSSAIFTSLMVKNKEITPTEGQRIINSIFLPSVSFLFVIVNSLLNDNLCFLLLILSIYLGSFIVLYLSSLRIKNDNYTYITAKQTIQTVKKKLSSFIFIKELKNDINYSFNTLINILGILIFFSTFSLLINKVVPSDFSFFYEGLIEFSIPTIKLLQSEMLNKKIITLLIGIIISFSSISSIAQATLFIQDASLNTKEFIANRIIISILTFIVLFLLFSFL